MRRKTDPVLILFFISGFSGLIYESVWSHYLKIFVRRLRQKLGDDAERPRFIQTEWGVGYRFASPQEIKTTPFPTGV